MISFLPNHQRDLKILQIMLFRIKIAVLKIPLQNFAIMIVAIVRKLKVLNCSDKNEIFLKQNINHRLGGQMISLSQHMLALSNTFENVKLWGLLYKVGLDFGVSSPFK